MSNEVAKELFNDLAERIAAKDREIAALQAALELEHEETKRLREIIAGLRDLSSSSAPAALKGKGEGK